PRGPGGGGGGGGARGGGCKGRGVSVWCREFWGGGKKGCHSHRRYVQNVAFGCRGGHDTGSRRRSRIDSARLRRLEARRAEDDGFGNGRDERWVAVGSTNAIGLEMTDSQNDYYEVLQISPNADPDTIHRVYRLLAQRFHPDNQATGDADRFRLLSDAYHVLGDPERRARYDVQRPARQHERAHLISEALRAQSDV